MNIIIAGRKLEVSEALKLRVEQKIGKIARFFDKDTDAHVVLSHERKFFKVEVTIHHGGFIYRAEDISHDMYASINHAAEILERQIRKNKTRLEKKLHESAFEPDVANAALYDVEEEAEYNIGKSKKFIMKPMSIDEAILQMNLLGHTFFVFRNETTNATNVVYKRGFGDYGIIEAE